MVMPPQALHPKEVGSEAKMRRLLLQRCGSRSELSRNAVGGLVAGNAGAKVDLVLDMRLLQLAASSCRSHLSQYPSPQPVLNLSKQIVLCIVFPGALVLGTVVPK